MSRQVPGPKASWPFYSLFDFRNDALGFVVEMQQTYGDLVHYHLAGQSTYLLSDPASIEKIFVKDNSNFVKSRGLDRAKPLLGEGLLTSEGEFHRRQRRLIQPAFHRKRIHAYAQTMVEETEKHQQHWKSGESLDMSKEMMELTLKIVGLTLFGEDVSERASAVSESMDKLLKGWWVSMMLPRPLFKLVLMLPLKRFEHFQESITELDEVVFALIRERRKTGEDKGDLLSMLLHSVDEEEGGQMSEQQARDEAMTLFLAGHETTANALSWTWYLLSQNPDIEAALHEELDSVLQGQSPTLDDLGNLPLLERVFYESMRLYPPAYLIPRKNVDAYEVLGHTLPPDSTIMMSPWVLHHDPRYWEKPWEFYPDHFLPEAKSQRPRYAYFPFGGGVRRCIGEAFALMEGRLLLATLCQKWKARVVESHPVEKQPILTLRPKFGIRMTLEQR